MTFCDHHIRARDALKLKRRKVETGGFRANAKTPKPQRREHGRDAAAFSGDPF
jgi:hypothetical protein